MRWGKLKRKLLMPKPYLLDPLRVRSRREVKRLIREEGAPSAMEVLESARIRAKLDPEKWEALIGMSQEELARKCRKVAPVRLGRLGSVSRRVALAIGLVLLAALFLAATPPGRAFARSFYNAVSELIGNILHVQASAEAGPVLAVQSVSGLEEEIELHFDSIDALADYVEHPVYYLASSDAVVEDITFTELENLGKRIEITYSVSDVTITLIQAERLYTEAKEAVIIGAGAGNQLRKFKCSSGIDIFGVYTEQDASFVGTTVNEEYVLNCVFENCGDEAGIQAILDMLSRKG